MQKSIFKSIQAEKNEKTKIADFLMDSGIFTEEIAGEILDKNKPKGYLWKVYTQITTIALSFLSPC